ncbi:MAG: hypothetical protein N3G80_04340 [Candidatus Micrarchaeota archaeon]|nr:hypothetical protein [Candidatus Micrarchaeota archaeon]
MDAEGKLGEELGEKLEEEISKKIEEFGGLLSREAAIRLLCKERGIAIDGLILLAEAAKTVLPFSFNATVKRVFPVQYYPGSQDCSVRLHIYDKSAEATLVLWNEQAKIAQQICHQDEIEVRRAYFRGGEIWVGKGGEIKIVKRAPRLQVDQLTAGICNVEGQVGEIEPDYFYIDKKTGKEKKMSAFQLCGKNGCRRVVIWQEDFDYSKAGISTGDLVVLDNVLFKNGEIHFNFNSRLIKKGAEEQGEFKYVKVEGQECKVWIGKRQFTMKLGQLLSVLGLKEVEGAEAKTLIELKASWLAGKKVRYVAQNESLVWLSE